MFTDPLAHLQAELIRLDLLLQRQILRLRASYKLSLDEFRGLYISDEQVDSFISRVATKDDKFRSIAELTGRAEVMRRENAALLNDDLPWCRLIKNFNLSPFEQDVLLLAMAPEIDLKYETLYAYLNNDISRKWPTCDLALRLFSEEPSKVTILRRYLLPEATLFGSGLLQTALKAKEHPSWLATSFSPAPVLPHHLLGLSTLDPCLTNYTKQITPILDWAKTPLTAELRTKLGRIPNLFKPDLATKPSPILIFEGRFGAGRVAAAEAVCRELKVPLLYFDMAAARAEPESLLQYTEALILQLRLLGAGVFFSNGEALFKQEGAPLPEAHRLVSQFTALTGPVFFAFQCETRWQELMQGRRHMAFRFVEPDFPEQRRLWELAATQTGFYIEQPVLDALANRFALTPGQINSAVLAAVDTETLVNTAKALSDKEKSSTCPEDSRLAENSGESLKSKLTKTLSDEVLFAAARNQSDQSLGKLALKVNLIHGWDDLILPQATLKRVQEITAAIKNRRVVYAEWGFEQRLGPGHGLMILFSGASGTGKTMTAGVITRDLGLDLYKIDLSGVVSKYIGETEKNLDRIFHAAQSSNAILFFDEADALFGKRSEVKDAHDRYANIEISYLLQKMEEHEGVVILASNLSKNIDQAFSRRMHCVIEFPLPNEAHREQLWRGMFPNQTPLAEDVDFGFLAKQFPLAGGDIKNVALDAAFLAAQDGRLVTMKQLIRALARQLNKQGKIPSATDFKQYHELITQNG